MRPGCRKVLVLATVPSPTRDYTIPNILDEAGGVPFSLSAASAPCRVRPRLEPGTWVVVLRYAHPSWLKALLAERTKLFRVTWFIDDDLAGIMREKTIPRFYAWRTYLRYLRIKGLLRKLGADLAFSTPELAARYTPSAAEIWPPRPHAVEKPRTPLVYFYHGTAAHRAELRWLVPIVAEVQRRVPAAWFEVFADRKAREFFRGIPRVRCIYPMAWPDYLAYTATFRAEVGLAPLLDTPFNRARAPVKFFDIARTGAAGIYSAGPTYGNKIRDGLNGLLLPNDPQQWTEAIVHLLLSPGHRSRIAEQAAIDCNATRTE